MNTGQRIAIIVIAVVVLGAGFVLAQGSDDDGGDERTPTAVEQLGETSTGTGGAEAPDETAQTQTQAAPPAPRVETIRIRGNQPASGKSRTLRFENGDTVRLRFRSDTATEVHVHGYDKVQQVPGGGAATLRFKAELEGIFEIEDHNSGAELAKLEVQP